jgi:hypothetical protein
MTRKLTNRNGSANLDYAWRIELPIPIEADWHPKWGPLLAGFPLELVYSGRPLQANGHLKPRRSRYCLDVGSFLEDGAKTEIRYRSVQPSEYFIVVTWQKAEKRWQTEKFRGTQMIARATGGAFEQAMLQTLLVGLQPDEPAA